MARAVATCLHAAGVSFAILGQEESCTGDPARRMGNDYVFQMLASGNVETLNRYAMGQRTIVTACPHCFNTIGNEYGQLGRHVQDRPPQHVPGRPRGLGTPGDPAGGRGLDDRRPPAGRRDPPRLVLPRPLQQRRRRRHGTCSGRPGSRSPRWRRAARTRSAAGPAAAGCGWRRRAAPGSTPSGRARSSKPAPPRSPRRARSAWSCSATGSRPPTAGQAIATLDVSEVLAARIAAAPPERRLPVVG